LDISLWTIAVIELMEDLICSVIFSKQFCFISSLYCNMKIDSEKKDRLLKTNPQKKRLKCTYSDFRSKTLFNNYEVV
jgi:hypothetical protein